MYIEICNASGLVIFLNCQELSWLAESGGDGNSSYGSSQYPSSSTTVRSSRGSPHLTQPSYLKHGPEEGCSLERAEDPHKQ